jgi:hypothetical protein
VTTRCKGTVTTRFTGLVTAKCKGTEAARFTRTVQPDLQGR